MGERRPYRAPGFSRRPRDLEDGVKWDLRVAASTDTWCETCHSPLGEHSLRQKRLCRSNANFTESVDTVGQST